MPPRISRSSVPNAVPKSVSSKAKKRSLDAYAAASKDIKEKRIPQHRLGEDLDDEPRYKRPRAEDDGDDDPDDDQRPRQKKRSSRSIANADDDVQYGSDNSGNEWTMGGLGDDDGDSELDSDEAFGESDEERFEGFTFRGSSSGSKKTKKRRQSTSNARKSKRRLDDDDSEGEDYDDSEDDVGEGFGEDGVDLATMLDESDEDMLENKKTTRSSSEAETDGDDEGEDEDDTENESNLSESEEGSEDEGAEEERVARMMDRLEALDSSRASRQTPAAIQPTDLTMEDLLSGVDAESRKRFEGETKSRKKAIKSATVAAPLPKRQQDRLDREVATQKAKEQLDRWRDTVIRNRRAEFLSFPMTDSNEQSRALGKEKFLPVDGGQHRTELEESIQRIMEESGLANKQGGADSHDLGGEEEALLKSEELATNKLPIEEVMRRRAELRKARSLLFREEIKAKRIAKIKSKSYRRVHRKERERKALQGLGDGEPNDEMDPEQADRKRAEARVATKHKDSKWSKAMKATNRTVWDENARDSVIDQARRKEELKKRIAGKEVFNDEDEIDSSEDGSEDENALELLDTTQNDNEVKGLAGMKFMRAAEERRRKANDEDVERLRRELAAGSGDDEADEEDEERGLGRAIFGPQAKQRKGISAVQDQSLEFEAPNVSDDEEERSDGQNDFRATASKEPKMRDHKPKGILKHSVKASGPLAKGSTSSDRLDANSVKHDEPAGNEWLKRPKNASKKHHRADEEFDTALDVGEPAVDTSKQKRQPDGKSKTSQVQENAGGTDGWLTVTYGDGEVDEAEHEEPILVEQKQSESLLQRAFAGDDVEQAFNSEKADIAESEDEKEISNHLPGWGSWTGEGLSKAVRKASQRAKHNPLHKTKVEGVRRADRKDAKLENVIISEKQDRKGKKYLAPVLPHGYETKAQYERSRRLPMGPEWSTKEVHQRMTRPRVVVKPGVRLEALERPLV